MGFWPVTKRVIKNADLVLLVLDVRMPELSKNKELLRMFKLYKKPYFLVFNKIDLVSKNFLKKVIGDYKGAFFVSGIKNKGINYLKRNLFIFSKKRKIKAPFIGIVGYPNVGKSAIINALAKRSKAPVSKRAGTTKGIQWIRAGGLRIIDSPGVIPFSDSETKLGVLGSKNPEKLKNIEKVALAIFKMFLNYDKSLLEKFYGVSLNEENFLEEIGRKKRFFLKKGVVDEHRTALQILKDWQNGKLRL